MSATLPAQVVAIYSRELLESAAKCFIRRYFREFGRWLVVACVVNAIGLTATIALGANSTLLILPIAVIVVAGPLYCGYLWAIFPSRYAAKSAAVLVPTAQLSFTESSLQFSSKGGAGELRWSAIKQVWECPEAFLLVLSKMAAIFIVVPKADLPASARGLLAGKVSGNAA